MHIEKQTGKRSAVLDQAHPPIDYFMPWKYYWEIRRGEEFKCSEVQAYKNLTGADIGPFETKSMLFIDDCVNERMAYHRQKRDNGKK